MSDWRPVGVCHETLLGDRRVGCSSLLVCDNDILVQGALRQWPDDESVLRLCWELRDGGSGEPLQGGGGGYGGGGLPGERFAFGADHWFKRNGATHVVVSCSLEGAAVFDVPVALTEARITDREITVVSARGTPTTQDRAAALRQTLEQRWPSTRATADEIERIGLVTTVGGIDVGLLALERWGSVRRVMVNLPLVPGVTGSEGPPGWWTVLFDGHEHSAVADGFVSGPIGLVGHLLVLGE